MSGQERPATLTSSSGHERAATPTQAVLLPSLFLLVAMLNMTLIVAGLKELVVDELGGSARDAGLFFSIEMVAYILFAPLWGIASDRLGHRKPLVIAGFLLSAPLYAAYSLVSSVPALLALRFVQGAVTVMGWSTLMAMVLDQPDERKRGRYMGLMGGALILGVSLGAPLGGYISRHLGARAPLETAAVLFLLLGLGSLALRDRYAARQQVSVAEIVATLRGRPRLLVPYLFYFVDRYTVGFFIVLFPLYLGSLGVTDPSVRGRYLALFLLPFALLQYFTGRLSERSGPYPPLLGGSLLYGMLLCAVGYSDLHALWWVMVGLGVLAAVMFPPAIMLTAQLSDARTRGSAMGGFNLAGSLGFAIGPVVGAWAHGAGGFGLAFIVAGAFELIAVAVTLLVLGLSRSRAAAAAATAPRTEPRQRPGRAAAANIYGIVLLDLLGFGIILPSLPYYARELGASGVGLGILFSAYSAAQFVGSAVLGRLSDRHGRRPILLMSLAGSSVAMALSGLAHGLVLLTLARALAGLFGGSISAAQAYIADTTSREERAKYMGRLGACIGAGFVMGPALGAAVVSFGYGFRGAAFCASALAAFNLLTAALRLPESRQPGGSPPRPLGFAAWLSRAREPALWPLLTAVFATTLAFVAVETTLVFVAQDRFRIDQRGFGLLLASMGALVVVVQGGLIGPLARRLGARGTAAFGAALLGLGLLGLSRAPSLGSALPVLAAIALGYGMTSPTLSTLISHVSRTEPGTLLGLGQSMGAAARAVGPLLAGRLYDASAAAPFAVAAGFALAAAVLLARSRSE
jgi:DHA1 family tetracycline resistance protein-like MFS transporter